PRPPRPTPFPYTTLFRSEPMIESSRPQAGSRLTQLAGAPDPQVTQGREREARAALGPDLGHGSEARHCHRGVLVRRVAQPDLPLDRKSTRLNSSHVAISY